MGAIDGTHIQAWVPASKQNAFRGRKGVVSQNVLYACDFDMMFTFVHTRWEGTTNDSRVFYDAITRPENEFPTSPEGECLLHITMCQYLQIRLSNISSHKCMSTCRSLLFSRL